MSALEILGYSASAVIAVSMTMNSIVKFRWINLAGALTFLSYSLIIEAYPVAVLNTFIAGVDLYYLRRIYNKSELFETLEVRGDNKYLLKFLQFYYRDIQTFHPGFEYKPELNTVGFLILRNMAVAGVFLAHKVNDDTLCVGLDFVVPEYRDYKNANFIYHRLRKKFIKQGISRIEVEPQSDKHIKYLTKINFKKGENGIYFKILEK